MYLPRARLSNWTRYRKISWNLLRWGSWFLNKKCLDYSTKVTHTRNCNWAVWDDLIQFLTYNRNSHILFESKIYIVLIHDIRLLLNNITGRCGFQASWSPSPDSGVVLRDVWEVDKDDHFPENVIGLFICKHNWTTATPTTQANNNSANLIVFVWFQRERGKWYKRIWRI